MVLHTCYGCVGSENCPDEIYFIMESVQRIYSKAQLNVSYHFFVVECTSEKELSKYEVT